MLYQDDGDTNSEISIMPIPEKHVEFKQILIVGIRHAPYHCLRLVAVSAYRGNNVDQPKYL